MLGRVDSQNNDYIEEGSGVRWGCGLRTKLKGRETKLVGSRKLECSRPRLHSKSEPVPRGFKKQGSSRTKVCGSHSLLLQFIKPHNSSYPRASNIGDLVGTKRWPESSIPQHSHWQPCESIADSF